MAAVATIGALDYTAPRGVAVMDRSTVRATLAVFAPLAISVYFDRSDTKSGVRIIMWNVTGTVRLPERAPLIK